MVLQVPQEVQEHQVQVEHLVHQEQVVPQEVQEHQVHQGHQEKMVLLEHLDLTEILLYGI